MAGTKPEKRWAVRMDTHLYATTWYLLFIERRPRKPAKGWTWLQRNCIMRICPDDFESFFPERFHLDPPGGPVQIEFECPHGA